MMICSRRLPTKPIPSKHGILFEIPSWELKLPLKYAVVVSLNPNLSGGHDVLLGPILVCV
ncbi:hypothetical protein Patl1_13999 [Pistacia atlantica]|uniref:Uncharacterized protein n=1 Tax=Pistacia atlantica TaxID=434234 RepID=A0ACC1AXI6_9ROSI|nr:hypothetical protein Patl1_13999 [Pistacia atlantica]